MASLIVLATFRTAQAQESAATVYVGEVSEFVTCHLGRCRTNLVCPVFSFPRVRVDVLWILHRCVLLFSWIASAPNVNRVHIVMLSIHDILDACVPKFFVKIDIDVKNVF